MITQASPHGKATFRGSPIYPTLTDDLLYLPAIPIGQEVYTEMPARSTSSS